jgi:HSP20 family protein
MGMMVKRETEQLEGVGTRPLATPRVDIYENQDELLVIADMPGVTQADLKIDLDEEQLIIEGRPPEENLGTPLMREFDPVDYRRSFVVPQGIDRDKVSAELRNGVLWLHLPKSPAVKPRRIEVKSA